MNRETSERDLNRDERVLVMAPTKADRQLSQSVLSEAEISCQICRDWAEFTEQLGGPLGAVLLTEEMLATGDAKVLVDHLATQPSWSDLPIVLLCAAGSGMTYVGWPLERLGNVTILERPVRLTTLISALRSALRARRRQYELRDQLRALEQSEDRFRNLADNIAQFAWIANELGRATWYNKRWYDYTGTTWEEMQDRGWEKVIHPDHLNRVNEKLSKCRVEGSTWEDTFPIRGKDGAYRWFLSRSVPIRNAAGEITCWFGTNTDITEQRGVEEALRDSESRVRQLLSLMPMAVYTCDAEGRISFFNRQAADLWGREPEIGDFDERFFGSFRLWRLDGVELPHHETPMALAIQLGRSTRNERVVLERPDGSVVTVSVNIDPLFDGDDQRVGAINVFEDVTERDRAEQQLRDADRKKDEFLAMLAHELRNPLAPIRTGLQVIQLCGDDRDTAADTLEMMDRQLRQLVRLIDDLLDISRITRGKIELRREQCEIATIVSIAVESSKPIIERAGVELTVSLPSFGVELDADPARLSQVFSNLLTNAAKFTPRGGHIWLNAEVDGANVVVTVRDSGIGIREDVLPSIFDMFTQVDQTERSHGGLGIGLSLVRALVDLHGGTVEAHSEGQDRGSEFVVRLPLSHRSSRLRPTSGAAVQERAAARRVLVVDDNKDAAKTLSKMLELMGNEIRVAHDGLEAVAAAEVFRPNLVLLDLGMPKLNGYEAAVRIRDLPGGDDVTLVALTGWGQDEDRRKTRESGFDEHLVKPIDANTLTALLNSVAVKSD